MTDFSLAQNAKRLSFAACVASLAFIPLSPAVTFAADKPVSDDLKVIAALKGKFWIPMRNQTYALCAGAVTFNFDGITYARCKVKDGDSFAYKHPYKGGNAETVNQMGTAPANGAFMVSTYSPPDSSEVGIYTCRAQGAYAQCNGGICFTDTSGKNFPTFGRLGADEIICSCPIVTSKNYYVYGPAQCPTSSSGYDRVCGIGSEKKMSADGMSLRIGDGGPGATVVAIDAFYDRTFQTSHGHKLCERPSGR